MKGKITSYQVQVNIRASPVELSDTAPIGIVDLAKGRQALNSDRETEITHNDSARVSVIVYNVWKRIGAPARLERVTP